MAAYSTDEIDGVILEGCSYGKGDAFMKTTIIRFMGLLLGGMMTSQIVMAAESPAPPIVFGGSVSLEGKYQEPSDMIQKSIKLWMHEINQRGGLMGRKVELLVYDDKSDVTLTRAHYQKLIEQDKVDFIFSPYGTPLTLAASDISEANQMLMLAIAAAAEKPWQRGASFLFQIYAPAKRQFIGVLDMMAKKNKKTLSILYDETSDFNLDIVSGVQEWAGLYKIEIVYQNGYRDGKRELVDLLAEAKSRDAKGLILSAYPPDCYELLRLLKKTQYHPSILAMPIVPAHPHFYKQVGPIANGILGPSQWEPDERIPFPGTRRFIDAFQAFTGHMPSFHATAAYAACQLHEQAIINTQSVDQKKLRDYIATLDTVTVLGRFKVDATGKQVGHNSFIIQWQNGKKEIVWPYKMRTAPPQLKD